MDEQMLITALDAMQSASEEADTIKKYTERMYRAVSEEDKAQYREIISDELNHIERFAEIYVRLTGIEPNTD